mmetsp:Transcript_80106/g.226745  ORF Transcript_80106/g.226745 Transcript_80106/m.226745 type:complete len:545 (+) Transcript_80106:2-1636(+)
MAQEGGAFAEQLDRLRRTHEDEVAALQEEIVRLRGKVGTFQEAGDSSAEQVLHWQDDGDHERQVSGASHTSFASGIAAASRSMFAAERSPSASAHLGGASAHLRRLSGHRHEAPFPPWRAEDTPKAGRCHRILSVSEWLVMHPAYEAAISGLIIVNAIIMAFEVQYHGIDVGHSLGHHASQRKAADAWPAAEEAFLGIERVFGIIYMMEAITKMCALRLRFWRDIWNYVDLAIVLLWAVSELPGATLPINPQVVRLARLARLLRLIRLVRNIQGFDALYLLTTAIRGSFSILMWTAALLFFIQMLGALLLNQFLFEFYFGDESRPEAQRREVWTYCGTFTRSFYAMFEITLANWPTVGRALAENVSEWFMLLSVVHKLTIGFAVIGVINGVFMQETFMVASSDDVIMLRRKERAARLMYNKLYRLFEHIDVAPCNGKVTVAEFTEGISNRETKTWLSSMEIYFDEVETLFNLIGDGASELTPDQLIHGITRLSGSARAIDLAALARDLRRLQLHVLARPGAEAGNTAVMAQGAAEDGVPITPVL